MVTDITFGVMDPLAVDNILAKNCIISTCVATKPVHFMKSFPVEDDYHYCYDFDISKKFFLLHLD